MGSVTNQATVPAGVGPPLGPDTVSVNVTCPPSEGDEGEWVTTSDGVAEVTVVDVLTVQPPDVVHPGPVQVAVFVIDPLASLVLAVASNVRAYTAPPGMPLVIDHDTSADDAVTEHVELVPEGHAALPVT